jgi:hypothetical protein
MFKSKQVNVSMIFAFKLRYRKYRYLNIEKKCISSAENRRIRKKSYWI